METYLISYYSPRGNFYQQGTDRRQLAYTLRDIRAQHGRIVGVKHV